MQSEEFMKYLLPVGVVVFLTLALAATLRLTGQKQDIRQKAAPVTTLTLLRPDGNSPVSPGDAFTANVEINTGANVVAAADIKIVFDPLKLELISIVPGTLLPTELLTTTIDNTAGNGHIVVGLPEPTGETFNPGVTGTGTIATLSFQADATGTSEISFDPATGVAGLDEDKGKNVLSGTVPLTVTISFPSPTPTPRPTPPVSPTPPASPEATPNATPRVSPSPTPPTGGGATPAPTPESSPGIGEEIVIRQINSSSDDVNQDGPDTLDRTYPPTYSRLWLGNGGTLDAGYTGLRFNNLTIPQGAQINNAYVEVYNDQTAWINMDFDIYADQVDNSLTFSDSFRPSVRIPTQAVVSHHSNANWNTLGWKKFENISAVIQEIVNRPNWQSGNSLSLILKGTGSLWGRKFVNSYDGYPARAPRLTIIYASGTQPLPSASPLTATPQPTMPASPMPTPVPTPDPTPVPSPSPATLVLKLKFEGITTQLAVDQLVKVTVKTGNQLLVTDEPVRMQNDTAGIFTNIETDPDKLAGLFAGEQNLYILVKGPRHLTRKFTLENHTLAAGTNELELTGNPLLSGDLNGDDIVDLVDYNRLVEDFGPRMPETGSPADINFDGMVDIFDYAYVVANFSVAGDTL